MSGKNQNENCGSDSCDYLDEADSNETGDVIEQSFSTYLKAHNRNFYNGKSATSTYPPILVSFSCVVVPNSVQYGARFYS